MHIESFLQVSTGTRTSCAIRNETSSVIDSAKSSSTSIHCWGGRANTLLDHFVEEQHHSPTYHEKNDDEESTNFEYKQISLGQDHACASSTSVDESTTPSSSSSSLQCWWMAGSNFGAHHVPIGLVLVV